VKLLNLAWINTSQLPVAIAGPIPSVFDVAIGDRFVVWSDRSGGQYDVTSYDLQTGLRQPLTTSPNVNERQPATSGSWIVWQAATAGSSAQTRIEALNVATGEKRVIVDNQALNRLPEIDGDLVSYDANVNGNFEVFLYRLSTHDTYQVTQSSGDQFLPDVFGNLIAYVDASSGNADILVSSFSPPETQLTHNHAEDIEPQFNPVRNQIVFVSDRNGNRDIFLMNADGSGQIPLTHDPGADFHPRFSPDGNKVAFVSSRDGDYDIFVVNTDGSGETRISSNSATDDSPSLSSDGSEIAYASNSDGDFEIFIARADGSGQPRQLTNNTASDQNPNFSPVGGRMATPKFSRSTRMVPGRPS
jgi:Tol biopolymer transport system component